jgi:hypothetical protein
LRLDRRALAPAGLFSSKPGVEHVCPITDDFEVLP